MPKTKKHKDGESDENLKKLTNPQSFGPGAWLTIHIMAYHAISESEKKAFEKNMKHICDGLKCHTCQDHCKEYLKNNPIRDYWNVKNREGKQIGMFKWSWTFHNAVNTRLGKPVLDFNTAYHLYSDAPDMVCTADCGSEAPEEASTTSSSASIPKKSHIYRTRIKNNGLVSFVPTTSQRNSQRTYRRRY